MKKCRYFRQRLLNESRVTELTRALERMRPAQDAQEGQAYGARQDAAGSHDPGALGRGDGLFTVSGPQVEGIKFCTRTFSRGYFF